jgi:para-aminobenzoate synthetase component 1
VVHQVLDWVPAARLARVIGLWPEPALLESAPGFGEAGRYSILAACPRLVFEATGSSWSLRLDSTPPETGRGDVLAILGEILNRYSLADSLEKSGPDRPPFQGGIIGFLGYDLAPRLERLPRRVPRDSRLPDIRMAGYPDGALRHGRDG